MDEENTSELWAIQVILLTSMSHFASAVLLDEAARTDITRTLTQDWFHRYEHLCLKVTGGCLSLTLSLNRVWLRPVLAKVKTAPT